MIVILAIKNKNGAHDRSCSWTDHSMAGKQSHGTHKKRLAGVVEYWSDISVFISLVFLHNTIWLAQQKKNVLLCDSWFNQLSDYNNKMHFIFLDEHVSVWWKIHQQQDLGFGVWTNYSTQGKTWSLWWLLQWHYNDRKSGFKWPQSHYCADGYHIHITCLIDHITSWKELVVFRYSLLKLCFFKGGLDSNGPWGSSWGLKEELFIFITQM